MIDMSLHPDQRPLPHPKRTHPLLEYKNLYIILGPIIKESSKKNVLLGIR